MCVLELQVYVNDTNNGFHQICNISVKIDDINDNSPVFPVPSISINITENDAIGKSVDISDNRADDHDYVYANRQRCRSWWYTTICCYNEEVI
jgi:hypothetical protein